MAKYGLSNAIREVLDEAEDSLSVRAIVDGIQARGVADATLHAVRTILYQRVVAGEFIKSEIGGQICYTSNPDFKPHKNAGKMRVNGVSAWDVIQAVLHGSDVMAAGALIDAVERRNSHLSRESIRKAISLAFADGKLVRFGSLPSFSYGLPGVAPAAESGPSPTTASLSPSLGVAAAAPEEPASTYGPNARPVPVVSTPEPAVPPAAQRPLGMVDRLEAIASDIKDAISDACDEELPHAVIKALVAADGAAQLALKKLAA